MVENLEQVQLNSYSKGMYCCSVNMNDVVDTHSEVVGIHETSAILLSVCKSSSETGHHASFMRMKSEKSCTYN